MLCFHFTLALLLAFSNAENDDAGVCYAGQEPVIGTAPDQLQWSIARRKPCECTQIHLGGLNVLPHTKPYRVPAIGGDRRMLSGNPLAGNCGKDGASPCATYKTEQGAPVRIPEEGNFTSFPVQMRFTVQSLDGVRIRFRDPETTLYGVELQVSPTLSKIYDSVHQHGQSVDKVHEGVAFGEASPFLVVCRGGQLTVGINGSNTPLLQYWDRLADSELNNVKAVTLHSELRAVWKFYQPCPR